jgi:hypothetical protein
LWLAFQVFPISQLECSVFNLFWIEKLPYRFDPIPYLGGSPESVWLFIHIVVRWRCSQSLMTWNIPSLSPTRAHSKDIVYHLGPKLLCHFFGHHCSVAAIRFRHGVTETAPTQAVRVTRLPTYVAVLMSMAVPDASPNSDGIENTHSTGSGHEYLPRVVLPTSITSSTSSGGGGGGGCWVPDLSVFDVSGHMTCRSQFILGESSPVQSVVMVQSTNAEVSFLHY